MADTAKSNGFDKQVLTSVVKRIEGVFAELLSERGSYMERCKEIRAGFASCYEDAKNAGIPRKELKALIKTRELERKIDEQISALEEDEKLTFQMLEEALGDFGETPLGSAALNAKRKEETLDRLIEGRKDEEQLGHLGRG